MTPLHLATRFTLPSSLVMARKAVAIKAFGKESFCLGIGVGVSDLKVGIVLEDPSRGLLFAIAF
jgi:hypothetical protein